MTSRNWTFTINNPTEDVKPLEWDVKYVIFQLEQGTTPHYQGYLELGHTARLSAMKKLCPTAHWETRKGSQAQNVAYCSKPDTRLDGPWTAGTPNAQGKRTDLSDLQEAIQGGERNPKRLRESHIAAYKFPSILNQMLADNAPPPVIPDILLKPWQESLYSILRVRPAHSDRTIHFVVDPTGGGGKSTFCNYLEATLDPGIVQVIKPARYQDMAFELDDQIHILLVDCPRSRTDILQYNFLEDVKDGRVSCSKYQSFQKRLSRVHVVCFTNESPDFSKLSVDRFNIINI